MRALFDIGNTRIKWAWYESKLETKRHLRSVGEASHASATIEDIAALHWSTWPVPEQIIVSSVASARHWQQLSDWCDSHWNVTPERVLSVASRCGVSNAYAKPNELGSDRWAAMIGAHHLLHRDTCIIDCGTAMTIDFLDMNGQHLGGYIIPGLSLMRQSLVQGTEAIQLSSRRLVDFEQDADFNPGTSTAECIELGVLMAAVALIEKTCKKIEVSTGRTFHCLLTGGNAESLAPCMGRSMELEPDLVLLGLAQTGITESEANSMNQRLSNT